MGELDDVAGWRRICVIGCCGAGKSTLARRLGALLDMPVVHLDHHYWQPGWVPLDLATFRARVAALAAADRWILDGNYASTMDLRLPRSDLVVLVDFPRRVCLVRVLRRLARSRGRPWNVPWCPERIDRGFVRYLWRWPVEGRPRTLSIVDRYVSPEALVRLGNPRAARRWLDAVARARTRDLGPMAR